RDLLFLGTEMGLFISIDGGGAWARYETEFPKVAVRDLAIHPREQDLLIATHGRGIWILDDITPLRSLTAAALGAELVILPTRPAVMTVGSGVQAFPGNDEFVGRNPPEAASIVYYQSRRHVFGDMRVEILDADGGVLTTLAAGKLRGMNRVDWPMRLPMPKMPAATTLVPVFQGPMVEEGEHRFRIVKGPKTYEGTVTLVPDPRADYSAEDRRLQQRTALELYRMLERLTYVVDAATDLRDQTRRAADSTRGGTARRLGQLADSLEAFRGSLVATSEGGQLSGDEKLREHLGSLFGSVNGFAGKPTASELARLEILRGRLDGAFSRFGGLTGDQQLGPLNRSLQQAGHAPLELLSEEQWRSRAVGGAGGGLER
ncbi:MAG: glycosyl hydrolase, partial [Gemmatimonadota bacterium]|nr:glycosyl hydrolase [Gemmatimonadota bacterium]